MAFNVLSRKFNYTLRSVGLASSQAIYTRTWGYSLQQGWLMFEAWFLLSDALYTSEYKRDQNMSRSVYAIRGYRKMTVFFGTLCPSLALRQPISKHHHHRKYGCTTSQLAAIAISSVTILLRWDQFDSFRQWNLPPWLSGYGGVLLTTRTRVRFLAAAAAILSEAKSENSRVFEISAN